MNSRNRPSALVQHIRRYTSRLGTQLTLLLILLVSLPTIIFTAYTLYQQKNESLKNILQTSYESTVQIASQINAELKSYASISNLFYLDNDLTQTLLDYQNGVLSAQDTQALICDISGYYNAGSNRSFSVLVVAEDGTAFGNALFNNQDLFLSLDERDWYRSLFLTTQTRQLWVRDSYLDTLFSTNGYPNIYLVRKLHNRNDWSNIGTLFLIISELEIRQSYTSYVSNQQSMFILDREMQTVSRTDNLGIGALPDDLLQTNLKLEYSTLLYPTGMDQASLLTSYTIAVSQWKLVYCHDLNSIISPFAATYGKYLMLMSACLVICAILSFLVIQHYISPITTLREQMDAVQQGNLDSHLPVTTNNEIGQLTAHFNLMQDSIHLLMQRIIEESEAKRRAEISALQSQINPHFLYNTLASVRFMIYSGEKENADNIVVCLIHLMKNALSNSQRFITLDMELRLLDDYISIQQYTFPQPFAVEIDVPQEMRCCYTIKLLLQPIVENAIFHGLKPKATDCLLQIVGRPADDGIDIFIRDNGVGFDTTQAPASTAVSGRIGMKNVNDRIQLYFGKRYGMFVTSAPGKGTEVRVHLPELKQEEDYAIYEHPDR